MTKQIACSFQVNDGEWQSCDDEFWLGPDETYHDDARKQVLTDVADDGGGTVRFRYELWVEDSTWELEGEEVKWSVTYPEEGEGGCYDSAESVLQDIAESGPSKVEVARLVRVHTFGETETVVPPKQGPLDDEDESHAQSGDTTSASQQTPADPDDSAPSAHTVSAVHGNC